ncbi:MAG: uracil-DNA glycosylase family protein [Pseudomonadota bacterium]
MSESRRVLSYANGSIDAKLLFVGEAPGRLGADDTAIPFHGDKAGHNFEALLEFVGLSRYDAFITNAVLCNPKDEKGNNSPPSTVEVRNCASYLADQIELINPKVVVTLGAVALRSVSSLFGVNAELRRDVGRPIDIGARTLVPLYHPGQRAMLHRSMANQRMDYQRVIEVLQRGNKSRRAIASNASPRSDVIEVVKYIVLELNSVSYFDLHKIFYLSEYAYLKQFGSRMTSAYFIRQKDGPYCTDLHWKKLSNPQTGLRLIKSADRLGVQLAAARDSADLFSQEVEKVASLAVDVKSVIRSVLDEVSNLDSSRLKSKVYLTREMKAILKEEKMGRNQINRALLKVA